MTTKYGDADARDIESASIHDLLPPTEVDDDVVVVGPALSGKQQLGLDLLAGSAVTGGQPFCITTTDPSTTIREKFAPYLPDGAKATVAIVDCLAEMQGREADSEWTQTVPSPGDLTGIGMALVEARRNLGADSFDGGRLLLDSVSTSLIYTDYEPIYKFLHTLTQQFAQHGGLSIATLDADTVPAEQKRSLENLFDLAVETRGTETGDVVFRVRGDAVDAPRDWHRYVPGGLAGEGR